MTSTTDAPAVPDAVPAPAAEKRTRPARKARPVKRRAEGQWKLGYREPLNPNEQVKKDDNPLNVRARIENIYSKQGFDSIDKQDLRGRMRWWGLYTQRAEGYDGTWTGDENIDLLEDSHFMMRVRCDAGALNVEQLRTLGELSTEFARDTADLSDRQNVQYHWIRIEDVPTIWERLEGVGLKTTEPAATAPPASCWARRSPVNPSTRSSIPPPRHRRDRPSLHRRPEVLEPAAQVQDRDLGPAGRGARDQRRRLRRRRTSRARPGSRPLGRWRTVHQPDARPARRAWSRSTRCPTCGRPWSRSSATTDTDVSAPRPV